jgi:hypothetical protein
MLTPAADLQDARLFSFFAVLATVFAALLSRAIAYPMLALASFFSHGQTSSSLPGFGALFSLLGDRCGVMLSPLEGKVKNGPILVAAIRIGHRMTSLNPRMLKRLSIEYGKSQSR